MHFMHACLFYDARGKAGRGLRDSGGLSRWAKPSSSAKSTMLKCASQFFDTYRTSAYILIILSPEPASTLATAGLDDPLQNTATANGASHNMRQPHRSDRCTRHRHTYCFRSTVPIRDPQVAAPGRRDHRGGGRRRGSGASVSSNTVKYDHIG